MPFNVAAGNSSGYNYASGRLDHQTYFKAIRVDQAHLECVVLDRILAAWLDEAALIPGFLPAGLGPIGDWPHQWFWDGHEHVDPAKEASAQAARLANHTTTLAHEYARQGRDWEEALRQRANADSTNSAAPHYKSTTALVSQMIWQRKQTKRSGFLESRCGSGFRRLPQCRQR